jgi:hypothetical protein
MEEAGASFARDDLVAPCPKGVMQIRQPIGAGGGGEAQHVFGNVLAEVDFAEPGVVAIPGTGANCAFLGFVSHRDKSLAQYIKVG